MSPIASLTPASIDFGTLAVGAPGNPVQATLSNVGSAPLVVGSASLIGAHAGDFAILAACPGGTVLAARPGLRVLAALPAAVGRCAQAPACASRTTRPAARRTVALAGTGQRPAVASIVVEYYHAAFDHYFITIGADEIAALDTGVFGGWARTGFTFKAHASRSPGSRRSAGSTCRPGYGDTHFYSASPAECAIVDQQNPAFALEVHGGDVPRNTPSR